MSSDGDRIAWWSGFLASLAGWGGIALAVALAAWRQCRDALRGLRLACRLVRRWGVEADATLAEMLEGVERAKCELELRTALCERALGLGVFAADRVGHWTWCSRHAADMLGRDTADCLGRLWLAGVSDEDRERVAREWRLLYEQGIPFSTHFAVSDGADDPRVAMDAWEVRRGGSVIGYIGQVLMWSGDDPPSWVVRLRRRNPNQGGE